MDTDTHSACLMVLFTYEDDKETYERNNCTSDYRIPDL